MDVFDIKKNVYIAYKSDTSRYLAYIFYLALCKKKLEVFYDKVRIEVSDAWKETLNNSLHKSNVCLIIGEKGAFDSLIIKEGYGADEFLNEVSCAIEMRNEKLSEIMYLAVEGYKPWEDDRLNSAQTVRNLQQYQALSFHFKDKSERLIKEEIKEVVSKCEKLCEKGFLKSIRTQSNFEGQMIKRSIPTTKNI